MVYKENLIAIVRVNNKILREKGSSNNSNYAVYMPFGSEYSIVLKNLNTVKALVNVEVDGREVISNLIIDPNSSSELERFFEGDMNKGHKLKFIEKTDDIKNFRGDKIEDGIIRITYRFEEKFSNNGVIWYYNSPIENEWGFEERLRNNIWGTQNVSNNSFNSSSYSVNNISFNSNYSCSLNEDGITVEGNESNQSFVYGNIGVLEKNENVININLKGFYEKDKPVQAPLTVKDKIQCKYCGKKFRSNHKFCGNCGAALLE